MKLVAIRKTEVGIQHLNQIFEASWNDLIFFFFLIKTYYKKKAREYLGKRVT